MIRLTLFSLFVAVLMLQVPRTEAGNTKCDMKTGQVPCNMKSCRHMAKKQQWCSPTCHNGCCICPQNCNGHNPEPSQQPEEEQ